MKMKIFVLFIIGMFCMTSVTAKRSKDPKDCEGKFFEGDETI